MNRHWNTYLATRKNQLRALKNIPRLVALLWDAGSGLLIAELVCRVSIGLLPIAALWVGKLIIDSVVSALRHPGSDSSSLWLLVAAEFSIGAVGAVLGRAIEYWDGRVADQFVKHCGLLVMKHASTLDLQSFEDPTFYDQLERARCQSTDRIGILKALGEALQQAITLVSLSVGVMLFSPLMFALIIVAVVPAFVSESYFASLSYSLAYSQVPLRREMDYLRDLGTKKESAKELKLFKLCDFLYERYSQINDELIGRNRSLAQRRMRSGALFLVLGSLGYYGVYAALLFRTIHGGLTLGELTFLAGALAGCSRQMQAVFSSFTDIAHQALFLTDLFGLFAVQPKIRNAVDAIPAPRAIRDGFEFRNVSFAYPGSSRLILKDVNLRIGKGERIAVVGENGQGKSTLVKLIPRLYEPTSGKVLLDGIDLREYDIESLRREIGVIFQDFVHYDMTARENITLGSIECARDEFRVQEAARKSGASKIIDSLPHGFDQMLGKRFEDGTDLSGGEWQKFALARAYLRDAGILILDEPTAALDALAEYEVFSRFAELTKGKIAILISHRLSTVRMADRIVVLKDGEIHEEGTHHELIANGGRYASMYELQAASYR
ncbi:MAG: ABC transporter ATP-binding protein/permease [Acidobacteriota bacterium]|nr:ABC transporter ATP-binding protein/permease [Acidobacteriota bacterium]